MKDLAISLGVILLFSSTVLAQTLSQQKTKTAVFKSTPGITLDVINKYGNVKVMIWEKDSVKVSAKLEVKAKTQEKLSKMMSDLEFDFSSSVHYLTFKTLIKSDKSNVFVELSQLAESYFMSGNSVACNYEIWVPKAINLNVTNKFGDVFIDDLTGKVNLNLSNGNLKAHDFMGEAILNVKFGDALINKFAQGKIVLSYADLHITNMVNGTIESKSSKIYISKGGNVKLNSKRDNVEIVLMDMVQYESSFSKLRIGCLVSSFVGNIKYGQLNIDKLSRLFKTFSAQIQYSDLILVPETGSSYLFDLTYVKSKYILPPSFSNVVKTDGKDAKTLKANQGTALKSKIAVNSIEGSITINQP